MQVALSDPQVDQARVQVYQGIINVSNVTDFLLIVDHKWRDLPGMAALRVWLEEGFGCSAELIHYGQWASALMQYRPQAIVLPHVNGSRNQRIARVAHEMDTRVVVIQTEGRPNNIETMEYAAGQFADTRYVDLWFTWSETVRDFMLERNVLPPERVVVGGPHRFDIYRPELNRLLMPRAEFAREYSLDANRPIVSWATNFTTAKFHVANQEFLLQDWQDLGVAQLPSLSDPLEFARLDWLAREGALESVQALMRAYPDAQFILKPHPAEELDYYRAFVEKCRQAEMNVTLVVREYIWDILNAVDVHIHRLCTTGVEAWLLDVPSIELHQFDYGDWSVKIPGAAAEAMQGNDWVTNADQLIERVGFYLDGGKPTAAQMAARERYIQRWLHRVDGRRCHEHARILSQFIQERRPIKPFPLDELSWQTRAKLGLNHLLRRPLDASLRFWQRPGQEEVDFLGQVDRTTSPEDARLWTRRAREALKTQIEAYR